MSNVEDCHSAKLGSSADELIGHWKPSLKIMKFIILFMGANICTVCMCRVFARCTWFLSFILSITIFKRCIKICEPFKGKNRRY
jgi:hypothetical protein